MQHLLQITEELRKHNTALVVPEQGIDTSEDSSAGELQLNVLAAVAQFERRIIVERINAGLAAARERGAKLGRPRTLDRHVSSVAKLSKRGMSGRKIAAKLNIPAGSVFAVLKKARNGSPDNRVPLWRNRGEGGPTARALEELHNRNSLTKFCYKQIVARK